MIKEEQFSPRDHTSKFLEKPEKLAEKRIKLVRLDLDQAYFIDSDKKPLVFDLKKRVWRDMNRTDALISIRDRDTTLSEKDQPEFKDADEAMIYTMKKRFQYLLNDSNTYRKMIEEMMVDAESRKKSKSSIENLSINISFYKKVLNLLDRLEKSDDIKEKTELSGQFKELFPDFDGDNRETANE